jgi:hypothetical protein
MSVKIIYLPTISDSRNGIHNIDRMYDGFDSDDDYDYFPF